ncbi:MAG: hypothetical protein AAGL89_09545 [Pseudomonadota bacterium]
MQDYEALRELARARTRESLRRSPSFMTLDVAEQKSLFQDIYQSNYRDLANNTGLATAKSNGTSRAMNTGGAGDMIDDSRHTNQRIDQAGELAGDFVQNVDFPGFVRDLLKGVFDANLEVTLAQMDHFQSLMKTATESVSKFVNAIDDTSAFGYLAENNSDDFNIDFSDDETDENGEPAAVLTDASGEPVDIGDNEVKSRIMDAKIAMAKEQRALLREVILMGVTRLVVEEGNVKASVLFDIKAGETIQKGDKAARKDSMSSSVSGNVGTGLIGKLIGGGNAGKTRSRRKTQISLSSVKSEASTDLAAKIAGSVDIKFKSDYFKLDNFATMYGPVTDSDRTAAGGGQGGNDDGG